MQGPYRRVKQCQAEAAFLLPEAYIVGSITWGWPRYPT